MVFLLQGIEVSSMFDLLKRSVNSVSPAHYTQTGHHHTDHVDRNSLFIAVKFSCRRVRLFLITWHTFKQSMNDNMNAVYNTVHLIPVTPSSTKGLFYVIKVKLWTSYLRNATKESFPTKLLFGFWAITIPWNKMVGNASWLICGLADIKTEEHKSI